MFSVNFVEFLRTPFFIEQRFWNVSFNKERIVYLANVRCSRPRVFLRKGVLKICSKCSGEHLALEHLALQLYWTRTSAWVFSCKFVALFSEHLFVRIPLEVCFCNVKYIKVTKICNHIILLVPTLKHTFGHIYWRSRLWKALFFM